MSQILNYFSDKLEGPFTHNPLTFEDLLKAMKEEGK